MRNRKLVILGMVCALAAMPVMTFGASTSKYIHSESDRDDSSSSSNSGSSNGTSSGSTSTVITAGQGQTVQNGNSGSGQTTTTITSGTIAPTITVGNNRVTQMIDTTKNPTKTTTDVAGNATTNASTATATTDGYYLGIVTNKTNAAGNVIAADAAGNAVIDGVTVGVKKKENGSDLAALSQAAQDKVKEIAQKGNIDGFTVRDSISITMEKNGVAVNETRVVPVKWSAAPVNAANMKAVCIRPDGTEVAVPIISIQNGIVNISMTGSGYIVLLTR